MQDNEQQDNFISISFSDVKVPEMRQQRGEDYVRFGEDNLWPDYLIYLFDKSPKHGAIVNGKVTYIYGKGLKAETPDPLADAFISAHADLIKKIVLDIEAFGMCYVQMIPTRGGKTYGLHHVSYNKIRTNKKNTKFWYKEEWKGWREEKVCFPAFTPGIREASIFMFKEYRPGNKPYGMPGFLPCCNYIESDIEVSMHTLTNAQTGFSGSKFINFYNGEPPENVKKSIERRFKNKYGGSQGDKIVIGFNSDPTKRPTVDDLGASDLTKEDFTAQDNLIKTNIYAGHQITNPALFGIPNENGLGSNAGAELKISYDIFNATYATAKREQAEKIINKLAKLTGVTAKLSLVELDPVGYTFTEATLLQLAPRSWLLEKLGIDPTKYPDAAPIAPATPPQVPTTPGATPQEQMVNESIKNLTAKQHAQLVRIIRQYNKGQLTREAATTLLKAGLGLTDADISNLLPPKQFSAETGDGETDAFGSDDDVAMLFEAHGEPADYFEVYDKQVATFKEDLDIEAKIKRALEESPKSTPKELAKKLGIDEAVITKVLSGNTGGAIGSGIVTNLPKFEVRYSYELRPGVEGPKVLETTRPFCRKMIGLNRLYTRTDIQKISAFLGYDVMLRSGGFWNNNGTVEYHCRHEFFSQLVIKKA